MHRFRKLLLYTTFFLVALSPLFSEIARIREFTPPRNGNPGRIEVLFSIPEGHYQSYDPEFFGIRMSAASPYRLGEIDYPEGKVDGDGERKFRGDVLLSASVTAAGGATGKAELIAFYQICQDDGVCLFPEEETIALDTLASGGPGTGSPATPQPSRLLFYLLLALAGGLLLNVMPCVLPVLSIKALNLVRQGNDDRRAIRNHALVFGAGVVGSLFALGILVVILKNAGEAVGWGFQFQNPYYVFTLIVILLVFALSLFDVWVLNVTAGTAMTRRASQGGYLGSLAGGVLTVLLATPCSAPFLGTALGFAFSQSGPVILLIFLFVGLGLALPFTLIGFFPSLIRRLPKPGRWMETFKEAMGILLLATAVWLVGVLVKQLGSRSVTPLLFSILGIGVLVWIWGRFGQRARRRSVRILSALILAAGIVTGIFMLPAGVADTPGVSQEASSVPSGWRKFSSEAVQKAMDEGKPVFIQFSADWCLTCKTNELTVFSRDEVNDLFDELGVVRFYGDYTNKDQEIGEWIQRFGKAGVPVYALYPPGRSIPVLLPEVLTPSILTTTLTNNLAW